MWFKNLALVFSAVLLIKSCIGIVCHKRFYRWDKKQYSAPSPPPHFVFFFLYGAAMLCLTWYATIFHYVEHGWILTAIITVSAVKMFNAITRWRMLSTKIVALIENHGTSLWILDLTLFIMGILFFTTALTIYS